VHNGSARCDEQACTVRPRMNLPPLLKRPIVFIQDDKIILVLSQIAKSLCRRGGKINIVPLKERPENVPEAGMPLDNQDSQACAPARENQGRVLRMFPTSGGRANDYARVQRLLDHPQVVKRFSKHTLQSSKGRWLSSSCKVDGRAE